MQADTQAWHEEEKTLQDTAAMFKFQGDYIMHLIDQTDYPSFDIEAVRLTFLQWKKHKQENIMAFRDNTYCSLMTGTMATPHHTPWIDALDDSLEAYLQTEADLQQKAG
jgi:trimethylamine monooxygenase